jgi:2-isopropylmalate synthase
LLSKSHYFAFTYNLELSVAKSLAAISYGARQIECIILDIGERALNVALEEFIMATKTRSDVM